ncbi:MAG: HEAT repeat domain-containing protein [Planctomycetes bacterium]|nr:HEAT repeat domain-containing protein [Planctomycetota bacterium]
MRLNPKTILPPLAAALVVAGLIYFRPGRDAGPGDGGVDETAAPPRQRTFHLLFDLDFPQPPSPVLVKGPVRARCERWFGRLLWAPAQQVFYTQNLIAKNLDAAEQRRFVDLVRQEYERDAGRAAVCITCLGAFAVKEAEDLVLEAALHANNRVRAEAARALSVTDSAAAALRAGELLDDPVEMVRRAAVRALTVMECPEALDVLHEYAIRNPEDGLRHVLFRLSQSAEDPSVIPVLRQYFLRHDEAGIIALEGLVRFGEANAMNVLREKLLQPDIVEQSRALKMLLLAPPEAVEHAWIEPFLTHAMPEMRVVTANVLAMLLCAPEARERDKVEELLARQAADLDVRVRDAALVGLYQGGRRDVVEPYLKGIAAASGMGLNIALDVTVRLVRDERALPLILGRLRAAPGATDTSMLIAGLGQLKAAAGLEPLLDFIRAARPGEPVDGNGIPLSQTAVLHITALGKVAQEALLAVLGEDVHEQARLRAVDALRGLEGADCLRELIAVSLDPKQSLAVRMAALESLPRLAGGDLFEALFAVLDQYRERELAQKALLVLYDYA